MVYACKNKIAEDGKPGQILTASSSIATCNCHQFLNFQHWLVGCRLVPNPGSSLKIGSSSSIETGEW